MLRPVNVLLLDEASNHLDTAAIDALTDALRTWEGAVVAVTHNKAGTLFAVLPPVVDLNEVPSFLG